MNFKTKSSERANFVDRQLNETIEEEKWLLLKQENPEKFCFVREGHFYVTYAEDVDRALEFLHNLFPYKMAAFMNWRGAAKFLVLASDLEFQETMKDVAVFHN